MAKIRLLNFSGETGFICSILLSTLFYTRLVLDYTLVPRFLLLSVSLLCILIWFWQKSKSYLKVRLDFILFSYVLYCFVCCSSILWAQNQSEAIFDSSRSVLGIGVFMLASLFLSANPALFGKIAKVTLALFFITMLVALFQLYQIKKIDRESIYLITGINSHKNLLSSFLFLLLLFNLIAIVHFSKGWLIIFVIGAVLNILILALLQTRAVWLGLFASLLVLAFLWFFGYYVGVIFKRTNIFLSLGCVVGIMMLCFLFVFPSAAGKLITMIPSVSQGTVLESSTGVERLLIWNKTFPIINEHLMLGVGAGNWQVYFPNSTLSGLWRVEDLNVTFQRPHNDFLWVLSETGIIGLSIFLIFIIGLIMLAIKTFVAMNDLKQRLIYALFISFATGFMVISFLDFPKERIEHTIWINVIYAFIYVKIKESHAIRPLFQINIKRWTIVFPLLLMMFIVIIGLLRFKGEMNTKKMYVFRDRHEWENVILSCSNASSFAYTLDPTSMPLNWYKGNSEASLQNYKAALGSLLLAKEYHPYNRNVLNDLGSAYVMNGNTEAAIVCYKESARISPRFDDPRLNLVSLFISSNSWSEAASWEKSIKHESERRRYYRKLIRENVKE